MPETRRRFDSEFSEGGADRSGGGQVDRPGGRAWIAADHPDGSRWSAAAPGDEAISAVVDLIHTEPARGWTNRTLAAEVGPDRQGRPEVPIRAHRTRAQNTLPPQADGTRNGAFRILEGDPLVSEIDCSCSTRRPTVPYAE